MTSPIYHIDCFAGPGGICTGFKAAGLSTLVAIEKVESCVETYTANHSEVPVIHKDIRFVSEQEVIDKVAGKPIHIISSGMPCETFSTAGSSSRSFYDFRQQLYSEAIRLAKAVDAKMILFENVPAIESKRVTKNSERFIVQDILDELAYHGYKHYIKTVLNAVDFGVPQNRNRFFLLASQDESLVLRPPVAHHLKPRTVADALLGLPLMEANDPSEYTDYTAEENDYTKCLKDRTFWRIENDINGKISYHIAPKHRPGTIERFRLIEPGENLYHLFQKFEPEEIARLQAAKVLPKKWFIQRNKRLELDQPSKTITSHCLDELIHPTLNRGLTVREMARLQGFPDFYDFKGGPFICPHIYETQDKYEQIGDAVPPLLAFAWGKTIIDILNGVPTSYKHEKPTVQEVLF
jgi:DNA (cytosine-5)-methyltransferase 1